MKRSKARYEERKTDRTREQRKQRSLE